MTAGLIAAEIAAAAEALIAQVDRFQRVTRPGYGQEPADLPAGLRDALVEVLDCQQELADRVRELLDPLVAVRVREGEPVPGSAEAVAR